LVEPATPPQESLSRDDMAPEQAGKTSVLKVLGQPRMLALLILGAASGFPNQITESALQAWLKDLHVSNTQIGIVSYVGLSYVLKFLWAPLLDRFPLPWLGRRRGWMLLFQLLLAATIAAMAFQDPSASLVGISLCAAAIVFFSASQDIVIDAYRADVSEANERGPAAATATLGYRVAAWVAPAVALIVADHYGWQPALLSLAVVMASFALASICAPEPVYRSPPPASLRESIVEPLRELLAGKGALALLFLVLVFKAGDAFVLRLFTAFLLDVGFSKTEIGIIAKLVLTTASVGGAIVGGIWMVRLGLWNSMIVFGVMEAVSNLSYCALTIVGKSFPLMIATVGLDNFTHAMGNVALVGLIMAMCDVRFSAFQYALLSVLASIPRYMLGGPAGWVADHGGWTSYFVVSFCLGLPGLITVWLLRDRIRALDVHRL